MPGKLFTPLLVLCLAAAGITGCVSTSNINTPPNPGDQFSLVAPVQVDNSQADLKAGSAQNQQNQDEASEFSQDDMDAAVALAEGIPYVRSGPHRVPPFPLALNRAVQKYVQAFAEHDAGIKGSFRRSRPYLPSMVKVLEQHNLPPELVYLPFAESSFSSKGAGPWQLSVATARRFHLRVNHYIDERRDPIKSTRAAAEYLATLHDEVGDWRVALVGWNRGESAMEDYWSLRGVDYSQLTASLPYNTRSLLNRFMAVAIIANQPERFGLEPVDYSEDVANFSVIRVKGGTKFIEISRETGVSVRVLRKYNPAILHDRVPPGPSYDVRLPLQDTADLRGCDGSALF